MFSINCVFFVIIIVFLAGLLGNAMQTMGMLDLGGGSTQITFMSLEKVCLLYRTNLFVTVILLIYSG